MYRTGSRSTGSTLPYAPRKSCCRASVAHNISEEKRGEGKFYRKATPGGWREDLTPEQAEAVETAPLLAELYPEKV